MVTAAADPAVGATAASLPQGSRRRRLWELPVAAHDLLLGLLLPPELLRQTVARAIGHQHAAQCKVSGNEVDVLFSTVHDLGQRNAVSQALHKLLDSRHVLVLRQAAGPRGLAFLLDAWAQALAAPLVDGGLEQSASSPTPGPPALLWALLTHPQGAALQDAALRDVRCWLYRQARQRAAAGLACGLATQRRSQQSQALADARQALQQAHTQAAAQAHAAALQQAELRGALARALALAEAAAAAAPAAAAAASPRADKLGTELAPELPTELPTKQAPAAPSARPAAAQQALDGADCHLMVRPTSPATSKANIAGRQVLCVGGIQRAVHRYRALVEARGGRFVHHDGGIEDSVQRLDSQLAAADLVLCQAGCVNHEAYLCVKAHCKRLGKPCLFLQRPSLSHFARGLGAL